MSYVLGVPSPEGLEENLRQQLKRVRFPTEAEQASEPATATPATVPPPTMQPQALATRPLPLISELETEEVNEPGMLMLQPVSRVKLPLQPPPSGPVQVGVPKQLLLFIRNVSDRCVDVEVHQRVHLIISEFLMTRQVDVLLANLSKTLVADVPLPLRKDLVDFISVSV
jgi:hypothetical protein